VKSSPDVPTYWRDVGTVDAYWEANIDLTSVTPELDLYDQRWPIFTHNAQLPPAKFVFDDKDRRGMATDSVAAGGVIVSGAMVRRSLLSSSVRVNSYADLDGVVALPQANVARGAKLHNVIIDRGVLIPEGLVVGEDPELDAKRFHRSPGGVTLITQAMLDALASS
jgi:glucose-1-phosphate adenylyltransferase